MPRMLLVSCVFGGLKTITALGLIGYEDGKRLRDDEVLVPDSALGAVASHS